MMDGKSPKSSKQRARPQYLQRAEANPSPGLTSGITHPGMNDVMFGRGGDTNYHIGNNSFRHVVESYREQYWASSSRKEKSKIIAAIITTWRTQDPPGRFLAKTDPTKGEESLWHDVGDQVAGRKASKILSEMRIGKQKAEAKRKTDGSPEGSPSNKKTKVADNAVEGVLNTLMDIAPCSAPHPAVSSSSLQHSLPQRVSQFAAAPLPAPQPATSNPTLQGNQPAANYLSAPSNLRQDNTALWGGSIFGQLQGIEQSIGETVPVAAALTSVFQDQYITSNMARRPSPSAHEDDDFDDSD